jgi:hypothetical protein
MSKEKQFRSVLIRGILHFIENVEYNFKGPMRRGLRPIVWYTQVKGEATSCALISDIEIRPGEKKEGELFILNEFQLRHQIKHGMILSIGSLSHSRVIKFGEFEVLEHLGEWRGGKVP